MTTLEEAQAKVKDIESGKAAKNPADLKAKAKEAAARSIAKRKEAIETLVTIAKRHNNELTEKEQKAVAFLSGIKEKKEELGTVESNLIDLLFESTIGASISGFDVYNKTKKGLPDMRNAIKKWAKEGTIVTYDQVKDEYTLSALRS